MGTDRQTYIRERERRLTWIKSIGAIIRQASTLLMIATFALCLGLIFFIELPNNNRELLYYVVGGLMGVVTNIFSYWYGSSSRDEDEDRKRFMKGETDE